mmetsp:Transcript_382/g.1249  ORF Transcript_382/g.1249 Transcript_382/m.1249 type:complete len:168 (-) Transcript_382:337-840(-)
MYASSSSSLGDSMDADQKSVLLSSRLSTVFLIVSSPLRMASLFALFRIACIFSGSTGLCDCGVGGDLGVSGRNAGRSADELDGEGGCDDVGKGMLEKQHHHLRRRLGNLISVLLLLLIPPPNSRALKARATLERSSGLCLQPPSITVQNSFGQFSGRSGRRPPLTFP